jgi:hypothetical protein
MPGEVILGHAKLESECSNCHVLMNKSAQDRLCIDCHKDVAADVAGKRGYHGRIDLRTCRSCHTEHKGRDARIVKLDERSFDHALTDYLLKGKHAAAACADCHKPGAKHRTAPSACAECHRKNDVHKGSLGSACGDCHTEKSWKEATFDHSKTRFALTGKHVQAECRTCHKDTNFRGTPQQCVACHRSEDKHKARYGEKCGTCHVTRTWKDATFDHAKMTRYLLRGRHAQVKCDSCHVGFLYRDELDMQCVSCHRRDDKHKGTLGARCESCHVEQGWKDTRFDHTKTRFALTGKHAIIECSACHGSGPAAWTPTACFACHAKDDRHKGVLTEQCQNCHDADRWKTTRFDHARDAHFALDGKHAGVACLTCHLQPVNRVKLGQACTDCHAKDDVHRGQQGTRCEQCHQEASWRKATFDHGRARFPLAGAHLKVACNQCHASPRFKDAKSECLACHAKKDVHEGRFGKRCETCHSVRAWPAWDFNHDRSTRFVLDGAHNGVRCAACHPAPLKGGDVRPRPCVVCHASDDVHDGSFGSQCARCHATSSFKTAVQPAQR